MSTFSLERRFKVALADGQHQMMNNSLMPPLFKDLNLVQLGYEDAQCDVNSDLLNMANMLSRPPFPGQQYMSQEREHCG